MTRGMTPVGGKSPLMRFTGICSFRPSRPGFGLQGLLALLVLGLGLGSCHRKPRGAPRISFQQVILERQAEGMHELIATMRDSSLIPSDQALVIVDEDLIRSVLNAAMPFKREIGNGIVVEVKSATILFEDGLALVQLDGRASLGGSPDVCADVTAYGDIRRVDLDPEEDLLRGQVQIIAYDEKRVNVMGMAPSVKKLLEDLTDLGLAGFDSLNYTIEIPVRLKRAVKLPAMGGPGEEVHIPEATIPLNVTVDNVKSFRGKLWITIDLTVPGAEKRGESAPRDREPAQSPEPVGQDRGRS